MENIENCKNDANDMESLKKHIFIIMYWLCNKFGILQTYCNRDQKKFLFETIFNFINYDKNEKNGKNYKLSMFYGKSTYICDALIMLYARTIIIFFNIIYCCIYGVLYYESEVFKNECQELLKESPLNIQSKFCLLSRKHSKFYEMLEFSHKKLGNNIDVIIFNFTIMIIFEISLLWHYFLNISNIIEIIQHFLSAFSMIYFEIIILMPINYMDKNLQIIKNIILNKSLIWNEQNLQLKGKALSIVTRSNHCEYYWLFFGLIPVKDKIIPILVLLTIILSAIIGPAVF
uniref:Gustatory receptor n=1 Tax=Strongyloides stercoralis TaxID=6248 RepID=A0AAF5DID4_STRER